MNYSIEEFLEDYEIWSHPSMPLPSNLSAEDFFGLLHAFFQGRYRDEAVASEREMGFRKTMAFLWNSQEGLASAGLIVSRQAKYGTLFDRSLLCGIFDLVVVKGIERATLEQIQQSILKFS